MTFAYGRAFSEIGQPAKELVGRTIQEILDDDAGELLTGYEQAIRGATTRVEYTSGRLGRTFDTRVEPLRDADGSVVGAGVVALDVTERRQAERAGAGANTILAAVSAAAGRLLVAPSIDEAIGDVLERLGKAGR